MKMGWLYLHLCFTGTQEMLHKDKPQGGSRIDKFTTTVVGGQTGPLETAVDAPSIILGTERKYKKTYFSTSYY